MPSEKEIQDATHISKKEINVISGEIDKAEEAVKSAVRNTDHGDEPEPPEVAAATLARLSVTNNDADGSGTATAKVATADHPDFIPGVFIGWNGFQRDSEYFFPGIWPSKLAISKSGGLVPSVVEGVRVDPSQDPEFSHWSPVKIMPGDTVLIPAFNEVLYETAVAAHEFATEEWADQIADWHDAQVDQRVILARVEKGDGLLKSFKVGAAVRRAVTDQDGECEDCHSTWRPDKKA